MALTNEDKKDVKGAFGKALANKVDKATNDKFKSNPFAEKYKEKMDTKHAVNKSVRRAAENPRSYEKGSAGNPHDKALLKLLPKKK